MKNLPGFFVCCLSSLLCLFFATLNGHAQENAPGKIDIPEAAFNFGVVPQGSVVQHDFEIQNKGAGPLRINKVVAQCGCTASAASKDELQPGEKGQIKVAFDTSNFTGDKVKTVTVYSNDPDRQLSTLTLEGRIEAGFIINPERILFGEIYRGVPVAQEFSVEVRQGSKSRVLGAKSFSRYLSVAELSEADGKKRFSVALAADVPLEEFRGRVTIETQGADGKIRTLDLPVFASVKGNVKLSPPVVSLGILEGKEPIKRSVKLEYRGAGLATIKRVESQDSRVRASIKEIEKGKNFVLSVEVDPSGVTKDLKAAVVAVLSGPDGQEETGSLNVYGILPPR